MRWIVVSYIVLNPLFFIPGISTRNVQECFFQASSLCLFACGLFFKNKPLKMSRLNISIGIMLIAFIATWAKAQHGRDILFNFLAGFLVYLTIIKTLDKDDIKFVLKGICWMGAICLFWMMLQHYGFDPKNTLNVGDFRRIDAHSIFYQRSAMGLYFTQILPMAMLTTPLSLAFLYPIYASECSVAQLGAVIGILFFLWFRKRIVFWVLLIPIIGGLTYSIATKENYRGLEIRLPIWKATIHDISKSPIGYGLDSFANPPNGMWRYYQYPYNSKIVRIRNKGKDRWEVVGEWDEEFIRRIMTQYTTLRYVDHPHNEFLWLGHSAGLISLVILGFIFYFIWQRFYVSPRDAYSVAFMASLISFSILCLSQFPLHLARVGHMLPIITGMFYISTEVESEGEG